MHASSIGAAWTSGAKVGTAAVLTRGTAAWFCIILVETLHGVARTLLLAPMIGDFRARQVAVFTGSILILGVAASCIRWIRPTQAADAISVGFAWLVLTLAFEIAFGRYVVHATWARIASDYDLPRGGLLPIGLAVLVLAPLIAAKSRRSESRNISSRRRLGDVN
jgi:hypothetical protein